MEPSITIPQEASGADVVKATEGALTLADSYANYTVTTVEEFTTGAEQLARIKGAQKELETKRFAITRPMDEAKKRVMDFFRLFEDKLDDAERHVKKGLIAYKDEQDRIAEEAARVERERAEREANRLREEAQEADRIAAEKERKRLAKLQAEADERQAIEDARLAEERAAAKSEEDVRRAAEQEEAARVRREREQERLHQERLASEAEQRERTARAEILEQRADDKTAAPLAPATPKVKGLTGKKVWKFEIVDVASVPDMYKTVDEKKIRGIVNALKDTADIPGVRIWSETALASRAR